MRDLSFALILSAKSQVARYIGKLRESYKLYLCKESFRYYINTEA